MLGREDETLVSKYQDAGSYSLQFNASKLSSGIYFYTLEGGFNRDTKKLVLLN
jgi:hypothetical protein